MQAKPVQTQGYTSSSALSSLPSAQNRTFSESKEEQGPGSAPAGLQSLHQACPRRCRQQEVLLQDSTLTRRRTTNPSLLSARVSISPHWDSRSRGPACPAAADWHPTAFLHHPPSYGGRRTHCRNGISHVCASWYMGMNHEKSFPDTQPPPTELFLRYWTHFFINYISIWEKTPPTALPLFWQHFRTATNALVSPRSPGKI